MSQAQERMRYAREVGLAQHAHRAVEDPIKLNKAARIVRAALAREMLRIEDLTPLPNPDAGDQ